MCFANKNKNLILWSKSKSVDWSFSSRSSVFNLKWKINTLPLVGYEHKLKFYFKIIKICFEQTWKRHLRFRCRPFSLAIWLPYNTCWSIEGGHWKENWNFQENSGSKYSKYSGMPKSERLKTRNCWKPNFLSPIPKHTSKNQTSFTSLDHFKIIFYSP